MAYMKQTLLLGVLLLLVGGCSSLQVNPEIADQAKETPTITSSPTPAPIPYPQNTFKKISPETVSDIGIVGGITSGIQDATLIRISPDNQTALFLIPNQANTGEDEYRSIDIASGEWKSIFGSFYYDHITWSPDSNEIAFTTGGEIMSWDLAKGFQDSFDNLNTNVSTIDDITGFTPYKLFSPPKGGGPSIIPYRWSPDNRYLVVSDRSGLHIWDIENQAITKSLIKEKDYAEYTDGDDISWSPDGQLIGFLFENQLTIKSSNEGPKTTYKTFQNVKGFSWSPKSSYLAIKGIDNSLIFYDQDWNVIHQETSGFWLLNSWSNSGSRIILSTGDRTFILDLTQKTKIDLKDDISYQWAPDDSLVISSSYSNSLLHWQVHDASTGETIFSHITQIYHPYSYSELNRIIFKGSRWLDNGYQLLLSDELWAVPLPGGEISAILPSRSDTLIDTPGFYYLEDPEIPGILQTSNDPIGIVYTRDGSTIKRDLSEIENVKLLTWDSYLEPNYEVFSDFSQSPYLFVTSTLEWEYFRIYQIDPSNGDFYEIYVDSAKDRFEIQSNYIIIYKLSCHYCDGFSLYPNGVVIINAATRKELPMLGTGNIEIDFESKTVSYQFLEEVEITSCEAGDDLCSFIPYTLHKPTGDQFTIDLP